jgi:hypothetical protein
MLQKVNLDIDPVGKDQLLGMAGFHQKCTFSFSDNSLFRQIVNWLIFFSTKWNKSVHFFLSFNREQY